MIRFCSHTEAGGHAVNEDAFDVRPHPADPSCWICALADGQGGRFGGALAAQLACRTCVEAAGAAEPAALAVRPDAWQTILQGADAAVAADPKAGFAALVAFSIHKDVISGATHGDTAAVAVDPGRPGVVLTERQHKDPPIGSGAARPVGFLARLAAPWTVLALSDGVWKYAGWNRVARAASMLSGKNLLDSLRLDAALPGSRKLQDDFTLVVLRGDGPFASPAPHCPPPAGAGG